MEKITLKRELCNMSKEAQNLWEQKIVRDGINVTEAQYDSMVTLIKQYKREPDYTYIELGYGALMCVYGDLTIGIEENGYAHS